MTRHHLPARLPLALTALALVAACGGGGGNGGAPIDTASARADSGAPDTGMPDSGAPGRAGVDTAPPVDTSATPAPADSAGPDFDAWSDAPESGGSPAASPAVLDAVRVAPHEGFDRLVFEFRDHVPAYTVLYADEAPRQCGSGRPVRTGASAGLRIRLRGTAAHDDQGQATVEERSVQPALPAVRSAQLICDFEGEVEWVVGVNGQRAFRAFTLTGPARLVVDVRHP